MATPVQDFAKAVRQATEVFRKGDIVTEKTEGGLHVITVDAFPEKPGSHQVVDVHFVWVGGVEGNSPKHLRDRFEAALEHGEGEFNAIDRARAQAGPSYIEWGGWLGDQTTALQMLGLGELLGWWDVVTPGRLGMPSDLADAMAGQGMVMNGGLKAVSS